MTKQVPITKILPVPDHPSKKEFLSEAGKVWKEHHPEGSGSNRGRPSVATFVFEACEKVNYKLIRRRNTKIGIYHRQHGSEDEDKWFATWGDCRICDKKFPPLSIYAIEKAITKELRSGESKLPCDKKILDRRTLEQHIKKWLHLQHHSEWLEQGIPENDLHLFTKGQIEAYARKRQKYKSEFETIEAMTLEEAAAAYLGEYGKPKGRICPKEAIKGYLAKDKKRTPATLEKKLKSKISQAVAESIFLQTSDIQQNYRDPSA